MVGFEREEGTQQLVRHFASSLYPQEEQSSLRCACRSIHVVSQVHTLIIVPMSIWCMVGESEEMENNKAFGWSDRVGYTFAVACG